MREVVTQLNGMCQNIVIKYALVKIILITYFYSKYLQFVESIFCLLFMTSLIDGLKHHQLKKTKKVIKNGPI